MAEIDFLASYREQELKDPFLNYGRDKFAICLDDFEKAVDPVLELANDGLDGEDCYTREEVRAGMLAAMVRQVEAWLEYPDDAFFRQSNYLASEFEDEITAARHRRKKASQ